MSWTAIALIIVSILLVTFWAMIADLGPRSEEYKKRYKLLAKKLARTRRENKNSPEKKNQTRKLLDSVGIKNPALVELVDSIRNLEEHPDSGRTKTMVKMSLKRFQESVEPEKVESH